MFLRSVFKICSRFFHRNFFSRRPRNPSTFQECVDKPDQSRSYWKPVFFILILMPTIYYMFYFKGYTNFTKETLNDSLLINELEKTANLNDIAIFNRENDEDIPIKMGPEKQHSHARKLFVQETGLPLCTTVTVTTAENENDTIHNERYVSYVSTNTSDEKIADNFDIGMGGYHIPKDCRPRHKVAILVPFWWNRKKSLRIFLYYIHPFLARQRLEYRIFVIEQHGDDAFNKGRLFNSGFLEIQKNGNWQCVIFHDVDLLPADNRIRYTCPVLPRHMCANVVGKENILKYTTVFGGVTAMTMWHYKKANGYSNMYWGKGESDDMFKRLQAAGLGVTRYKKDVGKYISLRHAYRPDNPKRFKLLVTAKNRYKGDGLSSLRYNVASYASFPLYTHIVVNVNNIKKQPDYITEGSITLSP